MHPAARIVDANANRAREALRVMEDVARFVLDDGRLCAELKGLRHALVDAIEHVAAGFGGRGGLLAWRDTPGDVGTGVVGSRESSRPGLRDLAAAASARLTEALRAIEECAKLGAAAGAGAEVRAGMRAEIQGGDEGTTRGSAAKSPVIAGLAGELERMRYRAYELERQLLSALRPWREEGEDGGAGGWRLCVLVSEELCVHHPWERVVQEAIAGGADCVQLREKSMEGGELLRRARRLVELARGPGASGEAQTRVAVVVNDRPDIALLAGADGVHLGQGDLPVRDARRIVGDRLLIGVSTANLEQARAAARDGADYCGVGPMFPTRTKDKPVLAGVAYLREYLSLQKEGGVPPALAIGGITPENAGEVWAAGPGRIGVAVSSVVCGAERPREVCQRLLLGAQKHAL